jgi:hypothetical protein
MTEGLVFDGHFSSCFAPAEWYYHRHYVYWVRVVFSWLCILSTREWLVIDGTNAPEALV